MPGGRYSVEASTCIGFEKIAVGAGNNVLTVAKYEPANPNPSANMAMITVDTAGIRYTMDGTTAPSSTVGHILNTTDDPLILEGFQNIAQFQFTQATGACNASISYFA